MAVIFSKQGRSEADLCMREAEGGLGFRKDCYGHKFLLINLAGCETLPKSLLINLKPFTQIF